MQSDAPGIESHPHRGQGGVGAADVFCEAAVGRLSPVGWSNNSKRGYLCKNS
jgi:hypothetical protein